MCKKWIFMVLLFVANFIYAQTTEDTTQHQQSGSHYIILGIIAIIVIIYILYRRQKRKFNE